MKISANHLKPYKEIALLLWKYGRSDLVTAIYGVDNEAVEYALGMLLYCSRIAVVD